MIEISDGNPLCELCGLEHSLSEARVFRSMFAGEGVTLEHVALNPMTFNTKGKLKAHCQEAGIYSNAL